MTNANTMHSLASCFLKSVVIAVLLGTTCRSQSLESFSGEVTLNGDPAEAVLANAPALIVFWSTSCSPCIKALSKMNAFAEDHPGITFVYVSAEKEERISAYTDTLPNIRFINDMDSTVWEEFEPEAWGVAYAFSSREERLWKGYTAELVDEILSSIASERPVQRNSHRFGISFSVVHEVGFGEYTFSVISHEDGQEWRLENKPMTSLVSQLVRRIYGYDVEIQTLGAVLVSTPLKRISVRFRYEEGEWKGALRRFLQMLCGGYDISVSVQKNGEDSIKSVVIDYTNYSG